MPLLKFDCSGGAAIKDRAHSRLIIDGATKSCSMILFQKSANKLFLKSIKLTITLLCNIKSRDVFAQI